MNRAIEVFSSKTPDESGNYQDIANFECNAHIVLVADKVIHELMHSFTSKILDFEAKEKNRMLSHQFSPYELTPTNIGLRFKDSGSVKGDMGYGFQGLLLGNGLTMKFLYQTWNWTFTSMCFESVSYYKGGWFHGCVLSSWI